MRSSACLLFLVMLPLLAVVPVAPAAARPNIVFIFIDDQGYYDLGCYGATEVKTPRIDAMANGGVRFTDYYAQPSCTAGRSAAARSPTRSRESLSRSACPAFPTLCSYPTT